MHQHFLFIDTETTGLPKKWTSPYASITHWPSAVQISWVVCNRDGEELKRANFYINNNDVPIRAEAQKIHGLDAAYLSKHGTPRQAALQALMRDVEQYQPLVVGHFVLLDVRVLGADFYRCALDTPLDKAPLFCTMRASARYVRKPWMKYLRLNELYEELFNRKLPRLHHALTDAEATAACFFELMKRGEIDERAIARQQDELAVGSEWQETSRWKYGLLAVAVLILIAYILFFVRF